MTNRRTSIEKRQLGTKAGIECPGFKVTEARWIWLEEVSQMHSLMACDKVRRPVDRPKVYEGSGLEGVVDQSAERSCGCGSWKLENGTVDHTSMQNQSHRRRGSFEWRGWKKVEQERINRAPVRLMCQNLCVKSHVAAEAGERMASTETGPRTNGRKGDGRSGTPCGVSISLVY